MLLHQLPKDILIQMISLIESDYKAKYLAAVKSVDMLNNLLHNRLEKRVCSHTKCEEYCYIYAPLNDNDDSYIITSQNSQSEEHMMIDIRYDGELYDEESDELFEQYGITCPTCESWFCANHWKENAHFYFERHDTQFNKNVRRCSCKRCEDIKNSVKI